MAKALTGAILIALACLAATWDASISNRELRWDPVAEVWDKADVDAYQEADVLRIEAIKDLCDFTPVESIEIPKGWPDWAVKSYYRLEEALVNKAMSRQERERLLALQEAPRSTIMKTGAQVFLEEDLRMSPQVRAARDFWEAEPLIVDQRTFPGLVRIFVPEFSYWTKVTVTGGKASVYQDYKGNAAIADFEEDIQYRFDAWDAKGFLGSAFSRPVSTFVRVFTEVGATSLRGVAICEFPDRSYAVSARDLVSDPNVYGYIYSFRPDGSLITRIPSSWNVPYSSGYSGELIWSEYRYLMSLMPFSDVFGGEFSYILKADPNDLSVAWETVALDGGLDIAELKTRGEYVVVGKLSGGTSIAYKLTESGTTTTWGNGNTEISLGASTGFYDVIIDKSGDIIMSGVSNSAYTIFKYEGASGTTEGDYVTEAVISGVSTPYDLCLGRDGKYVVLGTAPDGMVLEGYNSDLTVGMSNTFTISGVSGYPEAISPTEDGGYIITGNLYASWPDSRCFLAKTSRSGALEWSRIFNEQEGYASICYDVVQAYDGGFYVVGETLTPAVTRRIYVIKTNQYGETCSSGFPCE